MLENNNFKILLAQGDPASSLAMKTMLEKHGFHNLTLTDSKEMAIDLVMSGHVFDLVILDLHFAKPYDGVEACKKISSLNTAMPILIATGFDNSTNMSSIFRQGAHGIIYKPFTESILVSNVKAALRICQSPARQEAREQGLKQAQMRFC